MSCNSCSISKLRGADISSRFIPPKTGAISLTVLTISSVSCVSKQIGKALRPANFLKRAALPSIIGIDAAAPMLPKPSTALPSDTTATVRPLIVRSYTNSGFAAIALQGACYSR